MMTMSGMKAILVLSVLAVANGTASADRMASFGATSTQAIRCNGLAFPVDRTLDPRIALAVERDNLMPPDEPVSVVVQPRSDIDRATAPADHARLWRAIDTTALVVSTVSLAVDWQMTHAAAAQGWRGGYGNRREANPIMGPHPTTGMVNTYFLSTIVMNAALWYVLPPRYRSVIPAAVIGVQANTIAGNIAANGLGGAMGWAPATGSAR